MNDRYFFRGKTSDLDVFITGYYYYSEAENAHYIMGDSNDYGLQKMQVNPSTIGQCTGLLAKKSYQGTHHRDLLIFEGDIVKFVSTSMSVAHHGIDEGIGVVFWHNYAWGVEFGKHNNFLWEVDIEIDDLEIIGNIYDTPELMLFITEGVE